MHYECFSPQNNNITLISNSEIVAMRAFGLDFCKDILFIHALL